MTGSNCCASCNTSTGKSVRQVELADDDLDIHAEIVFIAENLDDAAARIFASARASR